MFQRLCKLCNIWKNEEEMATYRNQTGQIRFRGKCKKCNSKLIMKYRNENPKSKMAHIERVKKYSNKNRQRNMELIATLKSNPCMDCRTKISSRMYGF